MSSICHTEILFLKTFIFLKVRFINRKYRVLVYACVHDNYLKKLGK